MNPIHFSGCNAVFNTPSMTAAAPGDAVKTPARTHDHFGPGCVSTIWQPTPEEIARIAAGGTVYIITKGGLPPHFVQA